MVTATTPSGDASGSKAVGGAESSPVAPIAGFATGAPGSICGIAIVASWLTIAAGAGTAVTSGAAAIVVEEGDGAAVGLGAAVGVALALGVAVADGVGLGEADLLAELEGDGVGFGDALFDADGVGVGVGDFDAVGVGVGVGVGVDVGVGLAVGVTTGAGAGAGGATTGCSITGTIDPVITLTVTSRLLSLIASRSFEVITARESFLIITLLSDFARMVEVCTVALFGTTKYFIT